MMKLTPVAHVTFPGGYPLFYYVESDDGKLHSCPSCVNQNRVGRNVKAVVGHVNYENDNITCEICEKTIEPAYS